MEAQFAELAANPDIIVATPGAYQKPPMHFCAALLSLQLVFCDVVTRKRCACNALLGRKQARMSSCSTKILITQASSWLAVMPVDSKSACGAVDKMLVAGYVSCTALCTALGSVAGSTLQSHVQLHMQLHLQLHVQLHVIHGQLHVVHCSVSNLAWNNAMVCV